MFDLGKMSRDYYSVIIKDNGNGETTKTPYLERNQAAAMRDDINEDEAFGYVYAYIEMEMKEMENEYK